MKYSQKKGGIFLNVQNICVLLIFIAVIALFVVISIESGKSFDKDCLEHYAISYCESKNLSFNNVYRGSTFKDSYFTICHNTNYNMFRFEIEEVDFNSCKNKFGSKVLK